MSICTQQTQLKYHLLGHISVSLRKPWSKTLQVLNKIAYGKRPFSRAKTIPRANYRPGRKMPVQIPPRYPWPSSAGTVENGRIRVQGSHRHGSLSLQRAIEYTNTTSEARMSHRYSAARRRVCRPKPGLNLVFNLVRPVYSFLVDGPRVLIPTIFTPSQSNLGLRRELNRLYKFENHRQFSAIGSETEHHCHLNPA